MNRDNLIIKRLQKTNLGDYECSSHYQWVFTKLVYTLEQDTHQTNQINGRMKSYTIESINSSYNNLPQLKIDFVTPLENIEENGRVEIKCSSTTSNCFIFEIETAKIFFCLKIHFYLHSFLNLIILFLLNIENVKIDWYQQNEPLYTETLLTNNFTSNDLDIYKCVIVKLNAQMNGPIFGKQNSIGVRFRRKFDMSNKYEGVLELVEPLNSEIIESYEMYDEDPKANSFVSIRIKEPESIDLIKLKARVVLDCRLQLPNGKLIKSIKIALSFFKEIFYFSYKK